MPISFDNVEIQNLDKTKNNSAATLQYVKDYLPENNLYLSNAKVGINNNTPAYTLDVNGTVNSSFVRTNGLTVFNPLNTANQDTVLNLSVGGSSSGNPYLSMNVQNEPGAQWSLGVDNTDNQFKIRNNVNFASGQTRLVMDASGNLALGGVTPKAEITLSNQSNNKKIVLFDDKSNQNEFVGFGLNNKNLRYQLDGSGGDHIFYSASSSVASQELMRIKGNGKVSINEPNPSGRLSINTGNVDEWAGVFSSTTNKGSGLQLNNNSTNGRSYGIFSSDTGMLTINDQLTNNNSLSVGPSGSLTLRNNNNVVLDISMGNVSIGPVQRFSNQLNVSSTTNTNVNVESNSVLGSNDAKITVSQIGPTGSNFARVNLVSGLSGGNTSNEWSLNLDKQGNCALSLMKINGGQTGGQNGSNKLIVDRNGDIEIVQNLNVNGSIREKGGEILPVGAILPFAGATGIPGFLLCDGGEYDPVLGIYQRLFSVIGYTYGRNPSNNRFKVPDLRCRFPLGSGTNVSGTGLYLTNSANESLSYKQLGARSGAETHVLSGEEMASHTHTGSTNSSGEHKHNFSTRGGHATWNTPTGVMATEGQANNAFNTWNAGAHTHTFTTNATGSNFAHNNMPPYLVINYIIKY
jgi:microcystin-dependent protein